MPNIKAQAFQNGQHSVTIVKLVPTLPAAGKGQAYVSVISVWEVGTLEAKGRITLPIDCGTWVERALAAPGVPFAELTPDITVDSTGVPECHACHRWCCLSGVLGEGSYPRNSDDLGARTERTCMFTFMYIERYSEVVTVSITKLRSDLFNQVEHALNGENVEFIHKGVVFRIVPETKPMKLAKLQGQQVMAAGGDSLDSEDLLKEMEAEWERDWASL